MHKPISLQNTEDAKVDDDFLPLNDKGGSLDCPPSEVDIQMSSTALVSYTI